MRASAGSWLSSATGLWVFPGALLLVGPIVTTNGALDAYWRSVGTR